MCVYFDFIIYTHHNVQRIEKKKKSLMLPFRRVLRLHDLHNRLLLHDTVQCFTLHTSCHTPNTTIQS